LHEEDGSKTLPEVSKFHREMNDSEKKNIKNHTNNER